MRSKISDNIGFDDVSNTFFCLRCGKAGYSRMAQARGHLSQCPGTQRRKGIPVPNSRPANTLPNYLEPLVGTWQVPTKALSGDSQVPSHLANYQHLVPVDNRLEVQRENDERFTRLENHLDHMIDVKNPAPGQDWWSKYKGWIILAGVVLVAGMMKQSTCPTVCEAAGPGSGKKEQPGVAEKALSKVADRLVIKGVDSIFKAA